MKKETKSKKSSGKDLNKKKTKEECKSEYNQYPKFDESLLNLVNDLTKDGNSPSSLILILYT